MMQIKIGMDVAASEFFTKDGKYDLNFKKQPNDGAHVRSADSLCELYKEFVKDFPIVSIEDPFDQDDWSSWASLQSSTDIQLVGDDLLVTNPKRIAEAIKKKACNALLLKASSHICNPFTFIYCRSHLLYSLPFPEFKELHCFDFSIIGVYLLCRVYSALEFMSDGL